MEEYDHMPYAMKQFERLNQLSINVGILDSAGQFLQMIAIVNNDGTTIFAKNKPYLVIPVKQANGTLSFIKKKSVSIPARRFLEQTIIDNQDEWQDYMENAVMNIAENEITADEAMNQLGKRVVSEMQQEMTDWKQPQNAPLTINNKGRDDPLIDKGTLRSNISFEVVEKSI